MIQLKIPKTGRTIYLPEDLSECDYRQYIEMSALILRFQCQEISYDDFRVQGFYKLLDMKQGGSFIHDEAKYAHIYERSQLLDSFFEDLEVDGEKKKVIKQYYINNPIPSFLGTLRRYHGPSEAFDNVKFGEYVDGLGHFIDFNATGETKYLHLLMATFYRPEKAFNSIRKRLNSYDGDVRIKYNSAKVAERAKEFQKQHIGVVYGFYLFFASFQKYMTTCTIYIEGREIDMSVLFDDKRPSGHKESSLPGIGMKSLMYSFAESQVYGNLEQVKDAGLWEVLVRMYDLNKKHKDNEASQSK